MKHSENPGALSLQLDRRRILLVDDDSKLLSTLSSYLFRGGAWDVWQAHSCARARELWLDHRDDIDVVIVDVRLKDGNGIHLLHELRSDKPNILNITISGVPPIGGSPGPFLLKPFTSETLLSCVCSL